MKIATWNVNSVRARIEGVTAWLERHQPDVVLLQETKVEDFQFPFEALGNLGYDVAHFGQKTYNGVAILSRGRAEGVVRGFGDGEAEDAQSRLISAEVTILGQRYRVCSVYVPNGQAVGSDKYAYKLSWLARFEHFVRAAAAQPLPLVIGGDFNVAPRDIDVHDPAAWQGQLLCSEAERAAFCRLLAAGVVDAYRALEPNTRAFSWWDYRAGALQKDQGLRIDTFLMNDKALSLCSKVLIDREARTMEKASDHAPVLADL